MWQAWHNLTSTFVLHGRHSPSTFVLHGRRGTISHPPSFCVAGVALMALGGAPGLRDAYVTSTLVSRTMSHTSLSYTICLNVVVTHHLSYNLCQQFSHTQLCHTHTLRHIPSFTHNFVAHRLSHTIFHTSLWLKQERMEQKTHVYLAASPACFGMFAFLACLVQAKATGAEKLFGHQIQNSCFVYRHVYVAASSACFGMFAFPACLAQAKATGAENGLDIKFIIRLPACLPSYGLDIKFVVAVGQARLSRRISRCTTWSTEDHGTPHSAHSRSAVMPHAEQMTLQR